MLIKFSNVSNPSVAEKQINCPFCGAFGTFKHTGTSLMMGGETILCLQYCPSGTCNGIVIFILNKHHNILKTYPGLGRPINTEDVPETITAAFREAVACFANNCYVAAAIMIRKTLEEICRENEAVGSNLYKRLDHLATTIMIPQALKDGMHDLRLLGNDAAHIETDTYKAIGREELEISIDFTQEIIKALYQYKGLLDKLRSLKKATDTP